jgi:hypothetical protein
LSKGYQIAFNNTITLDSKSYDRVTTSREVARKHLKFSKHETTISALRGKIWLTFFIHKYFILMYINHLNKGGKNGKYVKPANKLQIWPKEWSHLLEPYLPHVKEYENCTSITKCGQKQWVLFITLMTPGHTLAS